MTDSKLSDTPATSDEAAKPPLLTLDSTVFKDVEVPLQAHLGVVTLTVEQLLQLKAGSVVKLETPLNDLVELHINQSPVALGELVAVGDHFGVRIVEIAPKK